MKIIVRNGAQATKAICELKVGECFLYDEEVWMITPTDSFGVLIRAVSLNSGHTVSWQRRTSVTLVSCELTVVIMVE